MPETRAQKSRARSISPKSKDNTVSLIAPAETSYQKANIPRALREQVWIQYYGTIFHNKCPTKWCKNVISVFDFQVGHNVPESKGGSTTIDNLIPLCSRCNQSMSNNYTFDEWSTTFGSRRRTWMEFLCSCAKPKNT
jgi:5-methylcytosine-specific restriction endonuclease McrA